MKRRIIIILVIMGILGGLTAGTWLYLRRSSGPNMLRRAKVAIQANKFDKAVDLAEKYITKYPTDWQGYHVKALAFIRLGRYNDARTVLAEAGRLNPTEVSISITLAESYSLPAGGLMAGGKALVDPAVLAEARKQFNQANEVLLKVKTSDPKRALEVQQGIGLNYQRIALAWRGTGERLSREASIAEASRSVDLAAAKRKESKAAFAESDKVADQSIKTLLEVVRKDASRPIAARVLVNLCIRRRDEESLSVARKAIMALKSPPPIPAMTLAFHEIAKETDIAGRRKRLEDLCRLLDDLLKQHPGELKVKLARANVAVMLGDPETAERLCKEILKTNRGQSQALLIRAKLLMQQGNNAEAAGVLFGLMPKSLGLNKRFAVDVHVAYALAAQALGEKDSAREAMRKVTRLDSDNARARRYLAGSFLQEGEYHLAFTEAQEYYRAHPDDPAALSLFAKTAKRTDQPDLAKKALEKAESDYKDRPEMMIVVSEGYLLIGSNNKAVEAMRRAAECKPATTQARLAVAQANRMSGRVSEAEKILNDELARNPNQPRFCFELGQLYAATGRVLQAIEQYQAAVRMDDVNVTYRLVLARALFNAGNLERCRSVLERIDATNMAANLLRLRVSLFRGESVSIDQALQKVRGAKQAGLSLAMIYLNSGQPKQCENVCLAGLKKTPDDYQLRFLLGQAHLVQGMRDKCLKEWSEVLKAAPKRLPIYLRIAGVLAGRLSPQEAEKALLAIPGARRDMVDLTMGRLFARIGDFTASAEAYGRLIDNAGSSEFSRNRGRLLRARMMAAGGDVDQALSELDKLSRIQAWRRAAIEAKTVILVAADRRKEAGDSLAQLRKMATEKKDTVTLRRIAMIYVRIKRVEEALAVCDSVEELSPNDAGAYLLRAAVLSDAGRRNEVFPLLQKAIDLQPGNVRTYLILARMLDAEHRLAQALEVLKRMEKLGRAGRATALYEQGLLFARRGLYAQSLGCFQKIAAEGHAGIPKIQLALGRAFAGLGQKDQARDMLKSVSVYSPQYIPAQRLLAEITETDEEKLKVLNQLEKVRPGNTDVLVQKMRVLLGADKPAEAVKVFHSFVGRLAKNRPIPVKVAYLAIRVMLVANDRGAASELASRMAKDTPSLLWKHITILLNLDDKSDSAAKMLPSVEKANFHDALLGLIISVQKDDVISIHKWSGRIDQINRRLAGMPKPGAIPSRYKLLVALAAGRVSQAETGLANFKSTGDISRKAAAELVSFARGDAKAATSETTNLLKAMVAIDLGLAPVAKSWAMEVLKARPKCQWAAALVIKSQPDPATLKVLLETLRPADCMLARMIRASLLMNEGKYEKAAEVYRKAAETDKDNPFLVLAQATATEKAGRLAEALSLYRKVWQATQSPSAGNNAAYLVTQLYPEDAVRLREALQWTEAAIKAAPQATAFHDTRGWVCFLLGRKEQARLEVRRAVKGLPNSPEVHYHMGVIEADAGNRNLRRWHLEAAVSSAEAIKAGGNKLTVAEARAAMLAKEALAKGAPSEK